MRTIILVFMSKLNKTLIVIAIVIVVALLVVAVWQIFFAKSDYYAVYMRNGDLYFGRLVRFPSFGLKNVYTIQVNAQNQQNPISVQRFDSVFWGPEDFLKINSNEVSWYTKLKSDGQMSQLIKNNPNLIPQQTQVNQQQQMQQVPQGTQDTEE